MANYLYNSVELPDINTVWTDKETYPYAAIAAVYGTDTVLSVSTMPYTVTDTTLDAAAGYKGKVWSLADGSWANETDESYPNGASNPLSMFSCEWSSYDVINTTDNSVYLAASDPVPVGGSKLKISVGGGNCLYNGVELPALPEYDESAYPYACIPSLYDGSGFGYPDAVVGSLFLRSATGVVTNGQLITPSPHLYRAYAYTDSQDLANFLVSAGMTNAVVNAWFVIEEYEVTQGAEVVELPILWSNYDILNEDGSVYLAASDPVSTGGVTDTTATATVSCSDLESGEAVYQVCLYVCKQGDSYAEASATHQTGLFAGPSFSGSYTFTGLAPETAYEVSAVLLENGTETEVNSLTAFTTLESAVSGEEALSSPAYIGDADGIARQLECIYIGDADGIAHKVLRAYVGSESGLACLWWGNSAETL